MEEETIEEVKKAAHVETRDIALAAALCCHGNTVAGLEIEIGAKREPIGTFRIAGDRVIEDRDLFFSGKLLVEPRSFLTQVGALKGSVHDGIRQSN